MSEGSVQEARLADTQWPERGRGCVSLRSAACSKLRTAVLALGTARTLWTPLCRASQYLTRAASSPQRRAARLPAPPSPLAKRRAKARDRRY